MAHASVILYIFCLHHEKYPNESGDEKYGISNGWGAWRGKNPPELQVKASRTVRRGDFSGLRKLQAISNERFVAGAIFYCGDMCISFEKNMFALPISILWDL